MTSVRKPDSRQQRTILIFAAVLIIILRFASGLSYSRATPAWESDSEPYHFGYAVQIADKGTIPNDEENDQAIQPPLYYLGLAAFLKLSGSYIQNFKYPERNPYFYYGTSGKNYALHLLNLSPEEKQIETSLRFGRFVTLLFSLIGVAFGVRVGRKVFPKRLGMALAFAVFFALWPQLVFYSSVVSNDAPAAVMGMLLTLQMFSIRKGKHSFWMLVGSMITLAIGIAFKLNVLLLIVPLLLAVLLTASLRLIIFMIIGGAALVAGMALLLASLPGVLVPVFARFYGNYSFFEALTARLEDIRAGVFIGDALRYAKDSFFALFGWGNVPLPDWINTIWLAGLILTVLGSIVYATGFFRKQRERPIQRKQFAIALTAVLSCLSGAIVISVAYASTHLSTGRYLFPALPGFLVLLLSGWLSLRLRRLVFAGAVALVILSFTIPPKVLSAAYAIPPEVQIADIPHKENVELVPGVRFLGWDIPNQTVYPGREFEFYLYWQAAYPLYVRYFFKVELIAPDGQGYAILETIPGEGNYLATDWQPRRTFRDHYKMMIRNDYPAPTVARLRVTVLPSAGFDTYAEFAEIPVHSNKTLQPPIPLEKAARFRQNLALRDARFEFFGTTRLQVYLTWQALDKLPSGTVFIHLLCGLKCPGDPISQKDIPPRDGSYQFKWWLPGEIVADTYDLRLPEDLKPGEYPIRVGVYDTDTPERLRWTVDYFGQDDGLLVGWLVVGENNQRGLSSVYPK